MRSWKLHDIQTPSGTRSPVILHSGGEGRAVLIGLDPGQQLGDHQVKEHAFLVVVEGTTRIKAGDVVLEADAGTLVAFEPDERRVVGTETGAKVLLLLAPWPGEGHYRGGDQPG